MERSFCRKRRCCTTGRSFAGERSQRKVMARQSAIEMGGRQWDLVGARGDDPLGDWNGSTGFLPQSVAVQRCPFRKTQHRLRHFRYWFRRCLICGQHNHGLALRQIHFFSYSILRRNAASCPAGSCLWQKIGNVEVTCLATLVSKSSARP